MNYYVRGTFTHNNLDFSKDVLHLADLGFKQISVEPVVAQPTDDYAIREEDLPILKEEYDKLAVEMIKRKKEGKAFNFFHFYDRSAGRSLRSQETLRLRSLVPNIWRLLPGETCIPAISSWVTRSSSWAMWIPVW